MSKIAIISQPDRGVLIDVGGCSTLSEATQHLTSTLQISSQFWNGMTVELNLGKLQLTTDEVSEVMDIAAKVGVKPGQVFASNELTKAALIAHNIKIASGKPMSLPKVTLLEESVADGILEIPAPAGRQDASLQVPSTVGVLRDAYEPVWTRCELPEAPAPSTEVLSTVEAARQTPGSQDHEQDPDPAPEASAESEATQFETETPAEPGPEKPRTTDGAKQPVAPAQPPAVLFLKQTLRSGQAVSHSGHLVIIGDVNPGAEVMAEGDITVWGALRGVAHAGIGGNTGAEIRALRLQAMQLRIAHAIARAPDRPRKHYANHTGPETARIVNGTIRIAANVPE